MRRGKVPAKLRRRNSPALEPRGRWSATLSPIEQATSALRMLLAVFRIPSRLIFVTEVTK